MRRAVAPAVPPKAYRHFAIVTLAVTASLAMFAEGEGRERQGPQSARPSSAVASAPATLAVSPEIEESAYDGWDGGDDSDGGFGSAAGAVFGGSDSGFIPDLDSLTLPGYPEDYLATLSEAERELLLQGLRENGMLAPELREQRRAALEAASDRRSGTPSEEA
jgi:hypothetical protein